MRPPKGHQIVLTEDGSVTLHSERFDENCHSSSGAKEETHFHYLEGCHVAQLLNERDQVNILEVGFGTGLGWRETLQLSQQYPNSKLLFISLEIDEELTRWALPEGERYEKEGLIWYESSSLQHHLKVLVGDARQTLPRWKSQLPSFHAIYQDAFSPKKNPLLWSVEWFQLLGELSSSQTRLATYSSSIAIRKALHEAGWGVYPGAGFGRKKSSTRAIWNDSGDAHLLSELNKHNMPPLRDEALA